MCNVGIRHIEDMHFYGQHGNPLMLPCCSPDAPLLLPCCSPAAPLLLPCCSHQSPVRWYSFLSLFPPAPSDFSHCSPQPLKQRSGEQLMIPWAARHKHQSESSTYDFKIIFGVDAGIIFLWSSTLKEESMSCSRWELPHIKTVKHAISRICSMILPKSGGAYISKCFFKCL